MDVHSTALKKNASEIFETNAFDPAFNQVMPQLVPTVAIEPKLIYAQATSASTIFTTPTDKDFFLTNMNISIADDATVPATGTYDGVITFTTEDGVSHTFKCELALASLSTSPPNAQNSITFPMRGLKLARNSTLVSSFGGGATPTGRFFAIAGYIGSDRS